VRKAPYKLTSKYEGERILKTGQPIWWSYVQQYSGTFSDSAATGPVIFMPSYRTRGHSDSSHLLNAWTTLLWKTDIVYIYLHSRYIYWHPWLCYIF